MGVLHRVTKRNCRLRGGGRSDPNSIAKYKGRGVPCILVRVEWSYLAVFVIVVAALAFFGYAVVRSQGTSVNVTVGSLRTGHANFDLAGVHFNQTGYLPPPFPDGSD